LRFEKHTEKIKKITPDLSEYQRSVNPLLLLLLLTRLCYIRRFEGENKLQQKKLFNHQLVFRESIGKKVNNSEILRS
jgi:hypothetical protein